MIEYVINYYHKSSSTSCEEGGGGDGGDAAGLVAEDDGDEEDDDNEDTNVDLAVDAGAGVVGFVAVCREGSSTVCVFVLVTSFSVLTLAGAGVAPSRSRPLYT